MTVTQEEIDVFIGKAVKYADEHGVEHDALLTAVWSVKDGFPFTANLVYITRDKTKHDSYGNQIERSTSCQRRTSGSAFGKWFSPLDDDTPLEI